MQKPDREPTDAEAKAAVFRATDAWPYERSADAPAFLGDPENADHIAREVQTYVEDERRPRPTRVELTIIVAFAVVVILGVAYFFGGSPK